MKAIYQSKTAYLQLSKGDVNRCSPVMGQTIVKGKYIETGKKVGTVVADGVKLDFYVFKEGADHNQLTLTDPTEIKNMRAYIERRHDTYITEVLFEGNEADLEEPVQELKKLPVKRASVSNGLEYDELSDWDKKMLSMVSR